MFKGLCRKFNALLRKEAVHENEPQRILFLLRIIIVDSGTVFSDHSARILHCGTDRQEVWIRIYVSQQWQRCCFLCNIPAEGTHQCSLICSGTAAGMGNCDLLF